MIKKLDARNGGYLTVRLLPVAPFAGRNIRLKLTT